MESRIHRAVELVMVYFVMPSVVLLIVGLIALFATVGVNAVTGWPDVFSHGHNGECMAAGYPIEECEAVQSMDDWRSVLEQRRHAEKEGE